MGNMGMRHTKLLAKPPRSTRIEGRRHPHSVRSVTWRNALCDPMNPRPVSGSGFRGTYEGAGPGPAEDYRSAGSSQTVARGGSVSGRLVGRPWWAVGSGASGPGLPTPLPP